MLNQKNLKMKIWILLKTGKIQYINNIFILYVLKLLMYWSYRVFVILCASQMLLSLCFSAFSCPSTTRFVSHYHNNDEDDRCLLMSQQNVSLPIPIMGVRTHIARMDAVIFVSGLLSAVFSVLYMQLSTRDEKEEDAAESFSTIVAWVCCTLQFISVASLIPMPPASVERLALRVLMHSGGLIVACGVAGKSPWTLGAVVLPLLEWIAVVNVVCSQWGLSIIIVQGMLDVLFFIGHRWEANPSFTVTQNCWVFHLAMSGVLVQAVILQHPCMRLPKTPY